MSVQKHDDCDLRAVTELFLHKLDCIQTFKRLLSLLGHWREPHNYADAAWVPFVLTISPHNQMHY